MRPKVLMRMFFHKDPEYRYAMRWYTKIGRRVWFSEVFEFLFRTRHEAHGPKLKDFLGQSLAVREYALDKTRTAATSGAVVTPASYQAPDLSL